MKAFAPLVALLVLGYSVTSGMVAQDRHVLLISGDSLGYLSPCGCTEPMVGGLRRRITAIKQMSVPNKTTVIETGGTVEGTGRQDQMKAEAIAETMKLVKVAAINFGLEEARLGVQLGHLSGNAMVATGLEPATMQTHRFKKSGPFLIGGIDPRRQELASATKAVVDDVDSSVQALLDEAKAAGLVPVLMTRGDAGHAETLAKKHSALRLIVCSTKSSPYEVPKEVGDTLIVTPGEHGKFVLRMEWDGKRFTNYKFVTLGPEYADDEQAQEVYMAYLSRVTREDLLSMVPRSGSPKYYGNALCISCHSAEGRIWKESAHAHALATLEKEGHDRDPDCVACHVVGLNTTTGFKDRKVTPNLTDVGCESCHGPGETHRLNPAKNKMGLVGEKSCMPCHTTENSPNFDFETYWAKIKH